MKAYKIVVTGAFNAGKTAFVRAASDIDIVTTERRITHAQTAKIKAETTVALDYGQVKVNGALLHLYGTPGQSRFDFMWEILSGDTDAFVLVVDSVDRGSLMEGLQIVRMLRKRSLTPYLIAANKQDHARALVAAEIKRLLKVPAEVPVVPCVAHDAESVHQVLQHLVQLL